MGEAKFKLSLEGDQEIQRKIEDINKAFKDLGKTASDIKRDIDQAIDGFENFNQAADETKDKVAGAKDELSDLKDEFSGVKSDIDDTKESLTGLGDAAGTSQSTLDNFNNTITDVSTNIGDAQSTLSDAVNTLNEVDPAAQDAKGGVDALKTAFEGVNTSALEADENIKEAVTGIEGLGTATPEAENAMKGLGSAFEGAGTESKTFNDVLSSTGSAVQEASGGLTSLNTVVENTGQSTQTAATGFQGLNQNVGLFVGFAGNAAGAGLQFANALAGIADAQIRVESLSVRASNAAEREANARAKLNELLASGSASAEEIAQAQQDVAQTSDAAAVASDRYANSQEDLNRRIATFAAQTLPSVITSVTSTVAAITQLQQAFPNLTRNISNVIGGIAGAFRDLPGTFQSFTNLFRPMETGLANLESGFTKTSQAAQLLRTSIAGISFTGFLAIVTAITTAILALSTNVGGSRDAVFEYGKAYGEAVPEMKPFLEFLQHAIEGLGELMGVQSDADEAMVKWATTVATEAERAKKALEAPFEFWEQFTRKTQELQSLNLLDKIFGKGGFGEITALMGQISGVFEQGTGNATRFKDVLEPVTRDLEFMGKNFAGVGGEVEAKYNRAMEFARKLTDDFNKTGVQPSRHELSILQTMIDDLGGTINTQYVNPIEQATQKSNEFAQSSSEATQALDEGKKVLDDYNDLATQLVNGVGELQQALQDENRELQTQIPQLQQIAGSWDNYNNGILESAKSTADHNIEIGKLNALLGSSAGQIQSYNEAVASGHETFLQWVQTTRQAHIEQETLKADLQGMAKDFGGLPAFMEPTIENYQAFIRANEEGGEAAKEFKQKALESWQNLASEAKPLFDDLKSGWADVFSGESMQEVQTNVQEINNHLVEEFTKLSQELGEVMSAPEFDQQRYNEIIQEMSQLYTDGISDMAEATSTEFTDPVMAAFDKLPPAVAATLDETERSALAFQAKISTIAEQAGQAWSTNLQANMSQGTQGAIQAANQAAQEVIAPFIAEHPETAEMFQPLFDAMQKVGPGSGQAVQDALQELSAMPGPVGEIATSVLNAWDANFSNKLAPGINTAMDQAQIEMVSAITTAISDMTGKIQSGFQTLTAKVNQLIGEIKQDPSQVPLITANTNPANAQIQGIGKALDSLKEYLEREENKISIQAKQENPLNAQIQGIGSSLSQIQKMLSEQPLTVSVSTEAADSAISGLESKIDQMAGKNIAITVNTGPAGTAIDELKGKIDAMAGKTLFIEVNTGGGSTAIDELTGKINAMVGKNVAITVDTGAAGIAITELQGNIDAVHGTTVPIEVDTGAAGRAIQELQQNIDNVHGKDVSITVNIGPALAAVQQLQNAINSIQQPSIYGGGGGFPGFQGGGFNAFARGFGPAFVTKPTRMLVGEAGPELVSVIPVKNRGRLIPSRTTVTAQTGMGYQSPSSYGAGDPYSGFQDATATGTEEGMDQSMGGMQDAVSQGVQNGMQQAGYPMAPSNTELFGAGRFTWSPGGQGRGAQYPTAPSNTEIFGAGRFTWGGGRAGAQLGGGNMRGAQYPMAPSNTELWGTPQTFRWTGGKMGTALGQGSSKGFVKAFETGMKNQSQLINGVPATILTGNQNPGQQAGFAAGQSVGTSFGQGFMQGAGDQINPGDLFPASMSSIGTPQGGVTVNQNVPPYTGKVPASYGPPLGQSINGVRATILPGMQTGSAGIGNLPEFQQGFYAQQWGTAQRGANTRLKKNTVVLAHKGEHVNITPRGRGSGQINEKMLASLMAMLTKLARLQSDFQINFNVDGAKLGRVSNKHNGLYGYGDRGG